MLVVSSVIGRVRVLDSPIVLSAVIEQSSILSIKSLPRLFLVDLDIDLAVGGGSLVSLMAVEVVRLRSVSERYYHKFCAKHNHGTG